MKKKYMAAGILCLCACILCLILAWVRTTPTPVETEEPEETEPEAEEPYVSEIDFGTLQEENPHIYAWLEVPGTNISYPVVQHPKDDTYYLNRDIDGNWKVDGSLFTEHEYNGTDLTDPVTVIYGHRMNSGAMFGNLQATYSDPESFAEHDKFILYLPDRKLTYSVFAAVPYDKRHILYNYAFENPGIYRKFFKSVADVRAIGANFSEKVDMPEPEERVVILSTCLMGDRSKRYLVMARCNDDF